MAADFSSVTGQAVRQWRDIFKVLKKKEKSQPRILSKNILQKFKRNKRVSDKQKRREFVTHRPTSRATLKEVLEAEGM